MRQADLAKRGLSSFLDLLQPLLLPPPSPLPPLSPFPASLLPPTFCIFLRLQIQGWQRLVLPRAHAPSFPPSPPHSPPATHGPVRMHHAAGRRRGGRTGRSRSGQTSVGRKCEGGRNGGREGRREGRRGGGGRGPVGRDRAVTTHGGEQRLRRKSLLLQVCMTDYEERAWERDGVSLPGLHHLCSCGELRAGRRVGRTRGGTVFLPCLLLFGDGYRGRKEENRCLCDRKSDCGGWKLKKKPPTR